MRMMDRARDSFEIKQLLWYIDIRAVELRYLEVFQIPVSPMRMLTLEEIEQSRMAEYKRQLMLKGYIEGRDFAES